MSSRWSTRVAVLRVDLDPAADALVAARALVAELEHSSREDQIAFRRIGGWCDVRGAAQPPRSRAAWQRQHRADRTYP
jgi:hypothetical protein